jgi:hypothetical protein
MRPVLAPSRHNKIPLPSITGLGICPTTNGLNFFLGHSLKLLFVVKMLGNEKESHPSA